MINTKERVIELFDNYFNNIENDYDISSEEIQYLKNKVKKNVESIDKNYYVPLVESDISVT